MIWRVKSEVFPHKSNALDYIARRRHGRIKVSFSEREREKKREYESYETKERERRNSSRLAVRKKYTRVVLLRFKLETHSSITYYYYYYYVLYMRAASIACQRKSTVFFVKRMPVTTRSSGSSKKASTMIMSEGGTGANIRVTTYNVLSSHLAEPTYFTSCDPKNLDALVRLERVQKK